MILSQVGQAKFKMVVEESDSNVFGTLHGGLGATLVDLCSSVAVLTKLVMGVFIFVVTSF